MNESEAFAFADIFKALQRVFPLRGDDQDIKAISSTYFKALRRYPIEAVRAGADQCVQRHKHFPKPAEWADAIPQRITSDADVRQMKVLEAREHLRAAKLGYEDEPCQCQDCRAAGVDHRFLRFVPDFTSDDCDDRVHCPIRGKIVTAGHWAHGDELRRWYIAKETFYVAARAAGLEPERILSAEPGEDG